MKHFLVCFGMVLLLLPALVIAQQKSNDDAVYLINGSIMRGKVLESVPGKGIKMEIVGNNILVIPENEIQKIVLRESPLKEQPDQSAGTSGNLELFPQLHLYGGSSQSWGFTLQTGYVMPCRVTAGVGTGVEWFGGAMLPVFGQVNWKFLPASLSPYVYAQAGYAFSLEKNYDSYYYSTDVHNYGGILAGGGLGIRNEISKRASLSFSVGYRYQKNRSTWDYNPYYWGGYDMKTERIENYNRIVLSLGFLFR